MANFDQTKLIYWSESYISQLYGNIHKKTKNESTSFRE